MKAVALLLYAATAGGIAIFFDISLPEPYYYNNHVTY
jgi:hypothetical protein